MSTPEWPVTTPTRSRRRRRWFVAIAVALVGVLTTASWFAHWGEDRAWEAACAEADRLDPGWRWDDLIAARPNPPDDQNAALRLRAVWERLSDQWPGTESATAEFLGAGDRARAAVQLRPDQIARLRR